MGGLLLCVLGASGSGKTTLLRGARLRAPALFFDDIFGDPALAGLEGETWQRTATALWCQRAARLEVPAVVLEGQTREAFVREGCAASGLTLAGCVLVDCSDDERRRRLAARGQPELGDPRMLDWARWLREDAARRGQTVLDTTGQTEDESLAALEALIDGLLPRP